MTLINFRMTRKYKAALAVAKADGIDDNVDQEVLYAELAKRGYQWHSRDGMGLWVNTTGMPAAPASDLVRIRVWAAADQVEAAAQEIIGTMQSWEYLLIEQSDPYPCRPPKQLESRVYLTFQKPEKGRSA